MPEYPTVMLEQRMARLEIRVTQLIDADVEQEAITLDHLIWLIENGRITADAPERQEIASRLRELAVAYRSGALKPITSGNREGGAE